MFFSEREKSVLPPRNLKHPSPPKLQYREWMVLQLSKPDKLLPRPCQVVFHGGLHMSASSLFFLSPPLLPCLPLPLPPRNAAASLRRSAVVALRAATPVVFSVPAACLRRELAASLRSVHRLLMTGLHHSVDVVNPGRAPLAKPGSRASFGGVL